MAAKYIPFKKLPLVACSPVRRSIISNLDKGPLHYEELYRNVIKEVKEDEGWDISKKSYSWHINRLLDGDVIRYDNQLYSIKIPLILKIAYGIADRLRGLKNSVSDFFG